MLRKFQHFLLQIAGLLSLNRGLTRLDMAANNLSGQAEETLIRSLEKNRRVLRIDLRSTREYRSEVLMVCEGDKATSNFSIYLLSLIELLIDRCFDTPLFT